MAVRRKSAQRAAQHAAKAMATVADNVLTTQHIAAMQWIQEYLNAHPHEALVTQQLLQNGLMDQMSLSRRASVSQIPAGCSRLRHLAMTMISKMLIHFCREFTPLFWKKARKLDRKIPIRLFTFACNAQPQDEITTRDMDEFIQEWKTIHKELGSRLHMLQVPPDGAFDWHHFGIYSLGFENKEAMVTDQVNYTHIVHISGLRVPVPQGLQIPVAGQEWKFEANWSEKACVLTHTCGISQSPFKIFEGEGIMLGTSPYKDRAVIGEKSDEKADEKASAESDEGVAMPVDAELGDNDDDDKGLMAVTTPNKRAGPGSRKAPKKARLEMNLDMGKIQAKQAEQGDAIIPPGDGF